jgi:formylglycine-generating enzyme required for sulfatase activity
MRGRKGENVITIKSMEFVFIHRGKFIMGCPFDDGTLRTLQVHSVKLDSFYMGKHTVTFDQYDVFCDVTGREKPEDSGWGRGQRPVIHVSWEDAVVYCEWISKETGENIRLPTEAEWEYAARERGKDVWFGNGKDIANPNEMNFDGGEKYKESDSVVGVNREKTIPVGSFAPNALGLHDMSGNVWEWCSDWYDRDYYHKSPKRNPTGPLSKCYPGGRIDRGGSWRFPSFAQKCFLRSHSNPDYGDPDLGFRCVMSK